MNIIIKRRVDGQIHARFVVGMTQAKKMTETDVSFYNNIHSISS